jgi:hypothetical protein
MNKLPPIPTPPAQRWREFRFQVLPVIIFAGIALSVAFLWNRLDAPSGVARGAGTIRADLDSPQSGTTAQSNRVEGGLLVSVPPGME